MKIDIIDEEEDNFKPIEIKIKIESELDLAWLWAIANSSKPTALKQAEKEILIYNIIEKSNVSNSQMSFFNVIDILAGKRKFIRSR